MAVVTPSQVEAPAAHAGSEDVDPWLRERLRTLLCCLFLILLATATSPGRIVGDTKIDMALNPLGFLARALRLWDVEQFGQLQNQAAGYLFPMGPFYALGHLAGVPPWITQRAWLGGLMCVAFLGARRLALRLRIGGPAGRLAGGMVYALGPHTLAALGINSSEYLPVAMLPWMVIPLIAHWRGRVRAAARSGLAVACCGGINGAATVAVLVVPVLHVLTRSRDELPGASRVRLLAWWCAATALATAWWAVPLVLLGRYAYSWLLYTEKADLTTATTGLTDVLRGTERWIDRLVVDGRPWWPLGHVLATATLPTLATGCLAALGIAGLLRSRLPERRFLLLTLMIGVSVMVAGHAGPLAPAVRELIDGPLAPFRNLYKFDGLVRLPLALGIAHVCTRAERGRFRSRFPVATAAALTGLVVPVFTVGLSGGGSFAEVPAYWRAATAWLNAHAGQNGVIAVPGARFGEYTWGRPMDEVTQPLLRARWAERELVPAGSAGLTRLVDAVDQRITSGQGSAGLTDVLARIGVRYILVRNDLRRADLRGAWPARVHEALAASPGIHRVAWFGAVPVGRTAPDDAVGAVDQPYPPVEIYQVAGAADVVQLTDADRALRLYGSPEALLTMADDGLLRDRPVLLDGDGGGEPAAPVVADSLRRVARDFGEIRGQDPPTMTAGDERGVPGQRRDIMEPAWERYSTVAEYTGIRNITASSSASDASTPAGFHDPGGRPYAAIDGDPLTRWVSGAPGAPAGQWLRVDFDRPRIPANLTVALGQDPLLGPPPVRVAVETENGRTAQAVSRTGRAQALRVPAGSTRWLRIRVLAVAGHRVPAGARVAITEVHIDGVRAERHYRLPPSPAGAAVVLSRAPGRLPGCMRGSVRWVCSSSLGRGDEEPYGFDRIFTAAAGGEATLSGMAGISDPELIQRYTSLDPRLRVRAGSVATKDPADLPRAAFDGDPATTWVPAAGDPSPWLSIAWGRRVTVDHLTVRRPPGASDPLQVRVEGDRGQWRESVLGPEARLEFRPMRVTGLTLRFSGGPPQITDVAVPGVRPFRSPPSTRVPLPCGFGPALSLDGRSVPTRATGTFGDLLAGRAIPFQACRPVTLAPGDNTLTQAAFNGFRIDSALVEPSAGPASVPPGETSPVRVTHWSTEDRQVRLHAEHDSFLVVQENANSGWQARIGGRRLRPVRIDGWRQGWLVPAGTSGTVTIMYAPGGIYRAALFGGLALLPALLAAAFWRSRSTGRPAPAGPRSATNRPGRAMPAPVASGPAAAAVRNSASIPLVVAVVAAASAFGFWAAGLPGACLAGSAALAFSVLPRLPEPAVLVMAAAVSLAAGPHLPDGGSVAVEGIPQALCLIVLARVIVALAGSPPEALRGPLDHEVTDGRDDDRKRGDHREVREEAPGEVDVAGRVVPADRDRELPEEDAVGDPAEKTHHPGTEDRQGSTGGGQRDRRDEEGGHQAVQQDPQFRGPEGVRHDQAGGPGER
jgi:arabinofuranan 3-O-arabinosyltransferase